MDSHQTQISLGDTAKEAVAFMVSHVHSQERRVARHQGKGGCCVAHLRVMESLLQMPLTGTEPMAVNKLTEANRSPNTTHHKPNDKTSCILSCTPGNVFDPTSNLV